MRKDIHLRSEQQEAVALLALLAHAGRYTLMAELYNPARENALTYREMAALLPDYAKQSIYTQIITPLLRGGLLATTRGGRGGSQYFVSPDLTLSAERLLAALFLGGQESEERIATAPLIHLV